MTVKQVVRKIPLMASAYGLARRVRLCGCMLLAFAGFIREYLIFKRTSDLFEKRFNLFWRDRNPCLSDRVKVTSFDRHYTYHLAWAARVLARSKPELHIDISSSLYFCSMISAFIPVRFYDYRPAPLALSGLECRAADLTGLPFESGSVRSLSCLHVIEHVGLGRYGDPLDPNGDLKAIAELKRVLAVGADLLLVVPLGGEPRIMFNAHRIYTYAQVRNYFSDMVLEQFALIPDEPEDGGLVMHAPVALADAQTYGCGCFWFRKIAAVDMS